MSLAAHSLGEAPIAAQPTIEASKKPPRTRELLAKPDAQALPEAR